MDGLDKFAWDNTTESIDFFGEVEYNPNKQEDKSKEAKEGLDDLEKEKTKETEKKEIPKEEEDAFKEFETTEKETEEDESEDSKKTSETTTKELNNIGVASFLKEKGFLDFELEEGEELDEDKASTLIEEKFEESVETKVNDLIKGLPETVKNLVKFAANGGNVTEYLSALQSRGSDKISKDIDLEDEKNQELVVRHKLAAQGEEDEDIETQIEFLKEKGKLGDVAEKHFSKWVKESEDEEKAFAENQKNARKVAKENQIKFKKEISSLLQEKDEIYNLKFSDTEKKELPDYISNASIELEDGRKMTPFYSDLFETLKDKEKTLALAKIIKKGLDFSDIEKSAKTKQTKELKENLQRTEKTSVSKGSSQPKRLTDYFN